MCSRYNLTSPPEAVRDTFKLATVEPFPPRYNIAPTQPVAIVRIGLSGKRELALVRWGLIPSWVKDPAAFSTLINARGESAADKPAFRGAMRHRRCLIPANGFYEWTGKPGAKQPHHIHRVDGGLMAFAGVWERWLGADGSEIDTMAILTVDANADVAPLHDRMPAILLPDAFDLWLDTRNVGAREATALLAPLRAGLLTADPIDPRLNNPRNEGPDLLVPRPRSALL